MQVCEFLNVAPAEVFELWQKSSRVLRLGKGTFLGVIDAECSEDEDMRAKLQEPIYLVNGFYSAMKAEYEHPDTAVTFMALEWDEQATPYASFLRDIIGDCDPAKAAPGSIRGDIFENWEDMGLAAAPDRAHNILHVSCSAMEGMVDRITWLKGAMLFTDLFGSRLMSARFKTATIKAWMENPLVGEDAFLFEKVYGMNSLQCMDVLADIK